MDDYANDIFALLCLYEATFEKSYLEKAEAQRYPAGYAMFLSALFEYLEKPDQVTIVVKNRKDLFPPTNEFINMR